MKKSLAFVLAFAMMLAVAAVPTLPAYAKSSSPIVLGYYNSEAIYSDVEVGSLPWDKVTRINHASWKILSPDMPEDGKARKNYTIGAISDGDFASGQSEIDPSVPLASMSQYGYYKAMYPGVEVLISIGGYGASGLFSEMAYTKAGRKSFIDSCIDLMDNYFWIDGIDINWEYPGMERASEGDWDEGVHRFGSKEDDEKNFTLLIKEMRAAFDSAYGKGKKLVTISAGATSWGNSGVNWPDVAKYADTINIMSFDYWGTWEDTTGFCSSVSDIAASVEFYRDSCGISTDKLVATVPFYGPGWVIDGAFDDLETINVAATPIEETQFTVKDFNEIPKEAGWVVKYDDTMGAAFMYNEDKTSADYKTWISIENEQSMKDKIDYVKACKLAGFATFEIGQDDLENGCPLSTLIASEFGISNKKVDIAYDDYLKTIPKKPVRTPAAKYTIKTIKKVKYIVNASGKKVAKKFITISKKKYRTDAKGAIVLNKFFKVGKKMYYANKSGVITTNKIFKVGKKSYYADKNGVVAVSKTITVNKVKYKADKNGALTKIKK